jgi:hypothetical protein
MQSYETGLVQKTYTGARAECIFDYFMQLSTSALTQSLGPAFFGLHANMDDCFEIEPIAFRTQTWPWSYVTGNSSLQHYRIST